MAKKFRKKSTKMTDCKITGLSSFERQDAAEQFEDFEELMKEFKKK